jgi:hypothetical protein
LLEGADWLSRMGVPQLPLEAIASGSILADEAHPNPSRYGHQRILVVEISGYACVVPYVRTGNQWFLKTIYRSRVYQKKYLLGRE